MDCHDLGVDKVKMDGLKTHNTPYNHPLTDPPILPPKSYEILPAGEIWWEMKLEWGFGEIDQIKKNQQEPGKKFWVECL